MVVEAFDYPSGSSDSLVSVVVEGGTTCCLGQQVVAAGQVGNAAVDYPWFNVQQDSYILRRIDEHLFSHSLTSRNNGRPC